MTSLQQKALRQAHRKAQEAHQLCITAWNHCKCGDAGSQPEHPLYQAWHAAEDAEDWLKSLLKDFD